MRSACADAGDAQLVELVVLADPGEGDAVVDLADLAQRGRRVLGADEDAVVVDDGDEAATPGDALAGVVGPVLHHLLGRDVERHAHDASPPASVRGLGQPAVAASRSASSSIRARKRSAISSSSTPVEAVGGDGGHRSGRCRARGRGRRWRSPRRPPRTGRVMARSTVSSRSRPSRKPSLTTVPACRLPEPVAAKSRLLVAAAGDVVLEEAAGPAAQCRSRRRAARRRGPAWRRAGCCAPSGRAGWPCPRG